MAPAVLKLFLSATQIWVWWTCTSRQNSFRQQPTLFSSTYVRPITGGRRGAKPPLGNFSPSLEKCAGHSLKILDIVQKILAPLGKLFALPGVPSWLRAWPTL